MTDVVTLSKKAFTWSVVVMTVLWSVGAAALVPATVQAAECPSLEAGDLFKTKDTSAVYLVNADLKRMYFPTAEVFKSWYEDYSGVQTIDATCTAAYPPAGGVNFRPGSRLFKTPISPVVYAVGPNNTKMPIADEATAKALYGANWASLVRDLADVFILNYVNDGAEVKDSTPHNGQLVKKEGSSDVYQVVDGMLKMVDGSLSKAASGDVRTLSASVFAKLEMSDSSVAASSVVADPAQKGGSSDSSTDETPTTGGSLQASLASDTPKASNVIISVDGVVFSKVALKNTSDKDVIINSFKIVRKGLGATGDFSSVTLYDANGDKIGTTKSSWHSDGYMTYNVSGGYTVKAGQTKTIEIHGKLGTAGTYNALGFGALTLGSGSVAGLPVYGNEMSGVNTSVGTVTMTGQGTTSQTKKIGTTDVTLATFRLALNSTEDGSFQSVTLKQKGTATLSDIANLTLYKGSQKLAGPVSMDANKKVMFVLDESYPLEKSKNVDFKVIGDIVSGDAKTVEFVLDATTDLVVKGSQHNVNMTVTSTGFDAAADSGTTATTIDGAELNIGFTSAAVETPDDREDIEFGRVTLSAGSTDVKITSMVFTVDETNGSGGTAAVLDIDELELVDVNDGSVYSGTMTGGGDSDADDETWTYSDEIYLEAGVARTFIIRGDMPASAVAEDTYKVTMTVSTSTIVAETVPDGDTVDNFSAGSITGKLVTVKATSLTVRPVDTNTVNAVGNESGVLLFKGTLESIAGDTKVERLRFEGGHTSAGNVTYASTSFDAANWSEVGLYIVKDGSEVLQETITTSGLTEGEVDFTNLDFMVKEGSLNKVTFVVRGTTKAASSFTAQTTVHLQLDTVTAKDSDNDSVTAANSAGTTITSGAELETTTQVSLKTKGILYLAIRNADAGYNKDRVLVAGTGAFVGKLRIKADYEDILLRDLKLTNTSADDEDSVESVCLYSAPQATAENKIACSTLESNDIAFFDDIDVTVTNGTHDWYIYVMTRPMTNLATGTADSHDDIQFKITTTSSNVVARGIDTGDDLAFGNLNGAAAAGEIVLDGDLDGTYDEAAADATTASTKTFTIAGSKITNVELVSSFGGETVSSALTGTGEYTVGIIKIATADNDNTTSGGEDLRLVLDEMYLNFDKSASTTISAVTVQRIGGSVSAATATSSVNASRLTANTTTSGYVTLDAESTSTGIGADAYIDAGQTAYFVVKATVSSISANSNTTDWLRMSLSQFDGSASTNNIDWKDGYSSTNFDYLRLDTSSITGTKIAELAGS